VFFRLSFELKLQNTRLLSYRSAKLKTRISTTLDPFDPGQVSKCIFNPYTCNNHVSSFSRLSGYVQDIALFSRNSIYYSRLSETPDFAVT
jgi:hypothetical protein